MDTYWYLATPYTNFPGGIEAAYDLATANASLLLKHNIPVFSPITHTHPMKEHGLPNTLGHDFWINVVDRPMMRGAHGLIFLEADTWQKSSGMHEEIVEFVKAGKPIVFMQPGKVPDQLWNGSVPAGDLNLDEQIAEAFLPTAQRSLAEQHHEKALRKATGNSVEALELYQELLAGGARPVNAAKLAAEAWALYAA